MDALLSLEEAQRRIRPEVRRVIVEVCCGPNSRLSQPRVGFTEGWLCIHITESDDFTTDKSVL